MKPKGHGLCIQTETVTSSYVNAGFPRWLSGKDTCQCRKRGSDPWVREVPGEGNGTSVFLSGKYDEQKNMAGYSPWGHKRVRHNLVTKQQ